MKGYNLAFCTLLIFSVLHALIGNTTIAIYHMSVLIAISLWLLVEKFVYSDESK